MVRRKKCNILSIYGNVRIPQNKCKKCGSNFFVLEGDPKSNYCDYCREDIDDDKPYVKPRKVKVIYHVPINGRTRIPATVRLKVFERDNFCCVYCGKDLYEHYINKTRQIQIDHFVPYTGAGEDEIHNLYTSCRKCNVKKYSNTFNNIEEVKEYLEKETIKHQSLED